MQQQSLTTKLPGSFPRNLVKNRNIDADHFISTYLKNEQTKQPVQTIKLRNPMYADFRYHASPNNRFSEQFSNTIIQPEPEEPLLSRKALSSSKSITSMRSMKSNLNNIPPPQIEPPRQSEQFIQQDQDRQNSHLMKPQEIQSQRQSGYLKEVNEVPHLASPRTQQPIYTLRVTKRQPKNKEKILVLPIGAQFDSPKNHPVMADSEMVTRVLNQYKPPTKVEQKEKYDRHDIIGHSTLQEYRPKYSVEPVVTVYDRPQFKDYALNQFSAAQVIKAKNQAHGKYDLY